MTLSELRKGMRVRITQGVNAGISGHIISIERSIGRAHLHNPDDGANYSAKVVHLERDTNR